MVNNMSKISLKIKDIAIYKITQIHILYKAVADPEGGF